MAKLKHNKGEHARPRIQRAFLSWFSKSRQQFKVPFRISKRTDKFIYLEATLSDLKVIGWLYPSGLDVNLSWQNGIENTLLWNSIKPVRTSDGYICSENDDPEEWGAEVYVHNERKTYQSREDVWRVHLFEVFLDYINNTLTKLPSFEFYDIQSLQLVDGVTVKVEPSVGVRVRKAIDDRLDNESKLNDVIEQRANNKIIPNPYYIA